MSCNFMSCIFVFCIFIVSSGALNSTHSLMSVIFSAPVSISATELLQYRAQGPTQIRHLLPLSTSKFVTVDIFLCLYLEISLTYFAEKLIPVL